MSSNYKNTELFESLAEYALVGLVVINKKTGKSIYHNTKAKEILNLQDGDDAYDIQNMIPKADKNNKFRPLTQELFEHEGLFQDLLVKKISGENFIASCGVRHLDLHGEEHILIMLQDTTMKAKMAREIENKQMQIKSAYEELLQQNKQLKELDVAKTRFIALVTHELRTPTSAVVATSEMLKLGLYDDEEQLKEFILMIYNEGQHLLELINDILDFAKIQNGHMDFFIEKKNITEILNQAVDSLESYAEKSKIEIKFDYDKNQDIECYFDVHRIQQVFHNLLSNGIKYNKPNGSINISIEKLDQIVRIHFKDTGKGISAENLPLVFNEFETLGKISSHTKGTGLGLPISKRMVESMGGTISLESEEGQGSDFWVDIPLEKVLDNEDHYRSRPEDIEDLAA